MSAGNKSSKKSGNPLMTEKGGTVDAMNVFIKFLPPQLTEAEFRQLFEAFGEVVSSKIMIDQATGRSLGYGFVRYKSSDCAQMAISKMNGQKVYNKRLLCKLANASARATPATTQNTIMASLNLQTPSNNLYIKPLAMGTSEDQLKDMFSKFGNVVDCKVMIDRNTGQSRQIGFVRFETEDEAKFAIEEMNGTPLEGEPQTAMTVKFADTEAQKEARRNLRLQQQQQQIRAAAAAANYGWNSAPPPPWWGNAPIPYNSVPTQHWYPPYYNPIPGGLPPGGGYGGGEELYYAGHPGYRYTDSYGVGYNGAAGHPAVPPASGLDIHEDFGGAHAQHAPQDDPVRQQDDPAYNEDPDSHELASQLDNVHLTGH